MYVPTIYNNNPFIYIWLENYYNSLPLWRRILMKFGIEKYKISQKEFEDWLFKNNLE